MPRYQSPHLHRLGCRSPPARTCWPTFSGRWRDSECHLRHRVGPERSALSDDPGSAAPVPASVALSNPLQETQCSRTAESHACSSSRVCYLPGTRGTVARAVQEDDYTGYMPCLVRDLPVKSSHAVVPLLREVRVDRSCVQDARALCGIPQNDADGTMVLF